MEKLNYEKMFDMKKKHIDDADKDIYYLSVKHLILLILFGVSVAVLGFIKGVSNLPPNDQIIRNRYLNPVNFYPPKPQPLQVIRDQEKDSV
jgi:hypothetical protein